MNGSSAPFTTAYAQILLFPACSRRGRSPPPKAGWPAGRREKCMHFVGDDHYVKRSVEICIQVNYLLVYALTHYTYSSCR